MFTYNAIVERVIDGDTVDVHIDLGFDIWHSVRLRLSGLDAPEMATDAGKTAKRFVKDALEGESVTITTSKTDKYGRYLAEIFVRGNSFNKSLLDLGFAVPYDGGKRTPSV
jgi:micrococcal nuclease